MSFPLPLSINDADAAERSVSYFTERKIFSALPSAVNYELSERGRSGFCQLFEKHVSAVDLPFLPYRLPLPISDFARSGA